MWQNIWASFLFCYTVIIWNSSQSQGINFLQSCPLASTPGALRCNSRNSTSEGAKVLTGEACHAILCAHACEVCTGYIHTVWLCRCHRRAPPPSLSVMLMLNCPSLKGRGWYSSHNVHSVRTPSLWSEGWRWSGCRQRRKSCKSYSADWAMSLTALVRNEYVYHSAYKRASWFSLNASTHWVAY